MKQGLNKEILLVSSGDLRRSANQNCWEAQSQMDVFRNLAGLTTHKGPILRHVVYTDDEATAHKACRIKAAALDEMGINVHFCGDVHLKEAY